MLSLISSSFFVVYFLLILSFIDTCFLNPIYYNSYYLMNYVLTYWGLLSFDIIGSVFNIVFFSENCLLLPLGIDNFNYFLTFVYYFIKFILFCEDFLTYWNFDDDCSDYYDKGMTNFLSLFLTLCDLGLYVGVWFWRLCRWFYFFIIELFYLDIINFYSSPFINPIYWSILGFSYFMSLGVISTISSLSSYIVAILPLLCKNSYLSFKKIYAFSTFMLLCFYSIRILYTVLRKGQWC